MLTRLLRSYLIPVILLVAALGSASLRAQNAPEDKSASAGVNPADPDKVAITAAIAAQAAAWNRADIPAFMQTYEESPETTFIGLNVRKGFAEIRERYLKAYTTPAQMGTLTFNEIDIRLLPGSCGKTEFAVVTGRFHLKRRIKGQAKKDSGIFSLVWHKTDDHWKILLDHTS
jgi:uncharacterized protein (TIGR02246 family)